MASNENKKMITLKSSDGKEFEVEEAVAIESQTIKHMVEDDCADTVILVANVTGKILVMVIEYCKKHQEKWMTEGAIKNWDPDLVKVPEDDQNTLFDLMLTANYLDIKSLLDLSCQTVADMIKGKTPEKIGKTFNIKNDFTEEEEEAQVHRENQWAFG